MELQKIDVCEIFLPGGHLITEPTGKQLLSV